uniref:Glycosyltransferase RgtA/B/C/D-like domain-containing protein n=1 Tax=Thermoanaerobaculum aquaticum TaxID=1312852 RepID=A0A7V2EEX1_9BACT
MVPLALAQPFFYDALVYHLALPWQALIEGGWHAHPESIYAAGPPLAQLCALPFLVVNLPRAYAFLHLLAFTLAGAALYTLCGLLGGRRFAFLAGFCLPILPLYVLVPGFPTAEGWAVLSLTVGVGLLFRRCHLVWAGLLAGLAVASRLQALPLAAGVALLGALRLQPWKQRLQLLFAFLLGSSLWWAKNWLLLGKPFLPFGGSAFSALSRDAAQVSAQGLDFYGVIRASASALAPHAPYLLPLVVAALGAVCLAPSRRVLTVASLAAVGLVSWPFVGLLTRFLAAASPLWLALPTVARTKISRLASGLALGVSAIFGLVVSAQELWRWGGFSLLGPAVSIEERLVVNNPLPAFRKAEALPENARVLFVGEPRGFLFPRRFIAPSVLDEHPLAALMETAKTPEEAVLSLRNSGFSHLLVNWGELHRLVPGYPCAPWRSPAGRANFIKLIQALEPPVLTAGPVAIYTLDLRRAPNGS